MSSMDPTTTDTIDADAAMGNEEETDGLRSISGESDGFDAADMETESTDGSMADELQGSEETEDGDKQYPGD